MACGNARREAYTAGGEASLWSLVILNVGAFIFRAVGAAPECRMHGQGAMDRPGSENDAKPRDGLPGNLGDPVPARRNDRWKGR